MHVTPDAAGLYSVEYVVQSSSRLTHVPLPVPDRAPASRERIVKIEVALPAGVEVYDDGFPQQTWVDARHGLANLPAVPSVVAIKFAPVSQISWFTRWSSVSHLSTVFMLFVLLAGATALYMKRRRALGIAR